MTAPNVATLWARTLVDELAAGGLAAACIAPGSRSTPLTVAFAEHDDVHVYSHLDERSAAFFALGRGRRTDDPTALVCTSGTAAANFHPAVVEADQARVPLLVLTADRPPELRDSGANQTVDQEKLYGDAVRWYRDLPEPEATPRKIRRLRTDAARALAESGGTPAGPVHLNCPFRKPLEPTPVPGDDPDGVPDDWADGDALAAEGREGPYVRTHRPSAGPPDVSALTGALSRADRPLVVAGPADPDAVGAAESGDAAPTRDDGSTRDEYVAALAALATTVDAPLLADVLSGARFGPHVVDAPVVGGYDAVLASGAAETWPDPDVVVRVGASPTSKPLRTYLAGTGARQFVVDPAGGWREAEFAASDLVVADPAALARTAAEALGGGADTGAGASADPTPWVARWESAAAAHWDVVAESDATWEGRVVGTALDAAPDPATVFVSNSMPVRDADRFARPRPANATVLANRGASGIDGVVSTALGAGSATSDPLVLVLGDLAYYHDMNGLLALARCGVDATVVLVDNDGGGIFHMLPIEDHETFTEQFKTPHGLAFEPTGDLYDLDFERVPPAAFESAYRDSLGSEGTQVLAVEFDAAESHRTREALEERVGERLS